MAMSLNLKYKKIITVLKKGGVGVIPTDTLYGIVGRAEDKKVVERIYKIKGRDKKKPFIILISNISDLKKFGVVFPLSKWPAKTSIILPCTSTWIQKMKYLHHAAGSLAFRLPAKKSLRNILKQTGPLVAPSANPEGLPPAKNIQEAEKYFDNKVDFYLPGGTLKGKPSNIIQISKNGQIEVLRGNIKLL